MQRRSTTFDKSLLISSRNDLTATLIFLPKKRRRYGSQTFLASPTGFQPDLAADYMEENKFQFVLIFIKERLDHLCIMDAGII